MPYQESRPSSSVAPIPAEDEPPPTGPIPTAPPGRVPDPFPGPPAGEDRGTGTTSGEEPVAHDQATPARRIAVVVAHNEVATIAGVLDRLRHIVDETVVVDDGSTDNTAEAVTMWRKLRTNARPVTLHRFVTRRGTAAGFNLAFTGLRERFEAGDLSGDDLVVTVDASGQHELDVLERLRRQAVDEQLDALLVCRDLTIYPFHKQLGNTLLSAWATLWARDARLHDVKSGYRLFRLGALAEALPYLSGAPQSDNAELAVVMSRLGHRIRNDILVPVPYYRSRVRVVDAVADFLAIPLGACRVVAKPPEGREVPGVAVPVTVTTAALSLLLLAGRRLFRPRPVAAPSAS